MSFLNPFLLLGLFAIAIPLIIHLIQLRKPKKVRFSTLAFFQTLQESTLRHIRLKQWLLLAIRTLALLLLALALARPWLPSGSGSVSGQQQPASVGLLIDNSPSMGQVDQFGPYINQIKRIADEIISQGRSEDRFFIEVTNGASLELPGLSGSGASARLDEINPENLGNFTLDNFRSLAYRLENAPQPVKQLYILTDGQATQITEFRDRSEEIYGGSVHVITVGETPQPNSAITSVELEHGGQSGNAGLLRVSVRNFGDSPLQNQFLSLEQNQQIIGQHAVELQPGEEDSFLLEMVLDEESSAEGRLELEGDEITFDNTRFVALRRPENRRVLLVKEESSGSSGFSSYLPVALQASFDENPSIDWVSGGVDLISGPDGWDAVLLDGIPRLPDFIQDELIQFVQQGGGLLFLPSADGDLNSYNRFLERAAAGSFSGISGSYGSFQAVSRLSPIRDGHPLLDGIFEMTEGEDLRINLPEIYYLYQFEQGPAGDTLTLLDTTSGHPVLLEKRIGSGRFLISSIGTDPGWSDLPVKPVFAPLFDRVIHYLTMSVGEHLEDHTLGEPFRYLLPGQPAEIVLEAGGQAILPDRQITHQGTRIEYEARDWQPGFLSLRIDDEVVRIALNQNTMESEFRTLSDQEMTQALSSSFRELSVRPLSVPGEELADVIQTDRFGIEIWHWFVILAFAALIAESIVSRAFKAESNVL
ncbi:MAG: BatA domain-containing protein [Balneolaceae bacterium]